MVEKYYIETYGCQMNFSDSEIIASILKDSFFELCHKPEDADIIFLNTCSIRDNAEQRIFNRLKQFGQYKKKKKNLIIGILGCMAERLKEKFFENNIVDIIGGPDSYRDLPHLIRSAELGNQSINTILSLDETYAEINPVRYDSNSISAFISIMRGCENFCTYCVVPYTRGKERSRDFETIIKEATELFSEGFKEITLLGQNVNSYNYNGVDFPDLVKNIAHISPGLRIRFATSHPKDISDKLIETIANHENICKSIHLPIQSGSNDVLKLMNRKYTREYYLERISKIKKLIPNCGISTDLIAGFCNETDEDHILTLEIMKLVKFDFAFMFKYSERPDTAAAKKYKDNVTEKEKTKRLTEIIDLQQNLSHQSNLNDVGKTFKVLVEGFSKRSKSKLFGRNSQNKVIIFPSSNYKPGDYVDVKITDCTSATLLGEI